MKAKFNFKKDVKAVLFDMDGTIVDSMPYHYISWYETLNKYGIRISPNDIFETEGKNSLIITEEIFKEHNKPINKAKAQLVLNEKRAIFLKYFKNIIFNEAIDIIKLLKKKGYLIGLVTGSGMVIVEKVLSKAHLNLFDIVVTVDMTKRGKPYPDPYLAAAKNLKLKPKDCLVIENAPFGIISAKRAEMTCFSIETTLEKKYLHKSDKIFSTHSDLYKYIKDIA
jgi:HAD superfamily hydrolase (TIGR01509 family)